MRTGVYIALLAQLVLSVLQIAIGPFLLVFVGFPRLDRLHCIYNLNKDDGTSRRKAGRKRQKRAAVSDDSLGRLFLSLLATIPHGIFVIVAFCSLYIQRPYVFDYHDWIYCSCVELFVLVFVMYFAPLYLQPCETTVDGQAKRLRKSHRKTRDRRGKDSDSRLSTRPKTKNKCPEHEIVNQRQRRRRRRRTFEFVIPIMEAEDACVSNNKKQEFYCPASKIRHNVKRKLKQKTHATNRKPQHVKIDINHKASVRKGDEIPPLPQNIKNASRKSDDTGTLKIIFAPE